MKTFQSTSIFLFLLFIGAAIQSTAQVNADIEGIIRSSQPFPEFQLFDSGIGQFRVEGSLYEVSNTINLAAFYDDLIFSSSTSGLVEERMRIDATTGNVGIGTNDPLQRLHAKGGNIMVENGSFYMLDGTQALFIDNVNGDLSIKTPGPAGSTQFYIEDEDGHIGINTNSPQNILHIKQTEVNDGIRLEASADTDYWTTYIDAADDFNFAYNGVLKAYILDTDGLYVQNSDRRLKNSIEPVQSVLDKVMQLKPSKYYYNQATRPDQKSWGFIAQEVEAVFPEIVKEKDGYKALAYDNFAIMSIKAIQEQQEIILSQADDIDRLNQQLINVLQRLNQLESGK